MKKTFDKWFEAESNNVETFNSIFLPSIQGFSPDEEVKIGEMVIGGRREVMVGDRIFLMDLRQYKKPTYNVDSELDEIVKIKDSRERLIAFMKKFKQVTKITFISNRIGLCRHTVRSFMNKLEAEGIVKGSGPVKNRVFTLV